MNLGLSNGLLAFDYAHFYTVLERSLSIAKRLSAIALRFESQRVSRI
jgi:hypothetical protein